LKNTFLESAQVSQKVKSFLTSKDFDELDLAIAYLTKDGYGSIESELHQFLKNGGKVRFLVSLSYLYITQSAAIRKLLGLTDNSYGKELQVKYHRLSQGEFHPKLMIAKSKGIIQKIIIGSSNLTSGGQESNIEANILVEIIEPFSEEAKKFQLDISNFFEYVWDDANFLTKYIVNEYAKGEKTNKKRKIKHGKVPTTIKSSFIYKDGKRVKASSFKVRCTNCQRNYVEVPINEFLCSTCGEGIEVITPQPNKTEKLKEKQIEPIHIEIDGKKIAAREVDVRCPDCNVPIGVNHDFALWLICKDCVDIKKEKGEMVCYPFTEWEDKTAQNMAYALDENRLIINCSSKKKKISSLNDLTHTPFKYRTLSVADRKAIKNDIVKKIRCGNWISLGSKSCIQIAKKFKCSAWQIKGEKAVVTKQAQLG